MEKHGDAYSILIANPFGTAGAAGVVEERDNEGVPRIVRNQILIRGAPAVARSLTAAGAATLAAGISIRSKPVKPKRFLHVTARDRKKLLKFEHGRNWKAAFRAEKKSTVHYRSYLGSPQVDVQEARVRKNARATKTPMRATMLKGAGGMMKAAGRAVPTLAAGMVALSYLDLDAKPGESMIETDRARSDVMFLHEHNVSTIAAGLQMASVGYAVGTHLLGDLL